MNPHSIESIWALEDEKTARILDAALGLILERGFGAMRIQDVADRAGIAAGTVYLRFKSKEDLANRLYGTLKARFADRVLAEIPNGAPLRLRFRALVRALCLLARDYPRPIAFVELHDHTGYLSPENRSIESRFDVFVKELIVIGQREALLKSGEPEALFSLLLGALVGVFRAVSAGRLEFDEATIELCDLAVWDLIRA